MYVSIDPERRRKPLASRLWLGVLVALVLAAATGSLHLLWQVRHWWALPMAVGLGHLSFGFSMMLSRLSLKDGLMGLRGSLLFFYRPYGGMTLLFYALLSLAEELFFRVAPITYFGTDWWILLLLAIFFSVIHLVGKRGFPLLMVIDFIILGMALGLLFVWLGDLWPLVIVHFIRNGSVAKVLVRRDRLEAARKAHDEAQAEKVAAREARRAAKMAAREARRAR